MWDEFLGIMDLLTAYPTIVPFTGFVVCFTVLLISMVTVGLESDIEMPAEIGGFDNPLVTAGLSKVPLFVGLTLTFLPMTIISYLVQEYALVPIESLLDNFGLLGDIGFYAGATVLMGLEFFGSLYIAKYLSAPIAKALQKTKFTIDYIGQTAEVSSLKVDQTYGEVLLYLNHHEHLLVVKAEEGQAFKKGDKVVIHSYDKEKERYLVLPPKKLLD